MSDFEKEWDDKIKSHMDAIRKGQEIAFKALIKEIRDYKYTTISQVNGALANHLDRLDEMTSERYEEEANLDHFTENQFNEQV